MEFDQATKNDMATTNSDKKPKSKKKYVVLFLSLLCLALIGAVSALLISKKMHRDEALRQEIIQSIYFCDGVIINGIPVGGLQYEEAKALVEAENEKSLNSIAFVLTHDQTKYPVTSAAFDMAFDTEAILSEAYGLCRSGTLKELQAASADLQANPRQFTTQYTANKSAITDFVAGLATQIDTPARDAEFQLLIDNSSATVEEKKSAEYVNAAATTTPEERFAFIPHQDGIKTDQSTLVDALWNMAQTKEYKDIEIPIQITPAKVRMEDIQNNFVLRATAKTSFKKSPYNRASRVFNIKKAVGLINGTVLQPGEVFSTNDTLGYRTYGSGWKPAPAIVQGRTEDQAGGGVCQVSSTLYNCVLKADMGIVYRQGHSGRLSYVDGGLDATIDSGHIDFKWQNTTKSPVYLFSYVDEENMEVYFELYGEPFPDTFDEIQLTSTRVSSISPPGPMQYVVDYSKKPGYSKVYVQRKSGSVWESYATYYKNGQVVKKTTLDRTTYRAYAGQTIVGPSIVAG